MFEGNLQEAGFVSAVQTDGQTDGLQPLEWPVLVARLAAARDLRSVFTRRKVAGKSGGSGNFACFSAGESSGETAILNKSAPRVNRNSSADCKDNEAIVPAAALEADNGDREL
jgi:hypothetical protein